MQLEQTIVILREMVGLAARRRCMVCGFPLAGSEAQGCVQGNCSYRPGVNSPEYERWHVRMQIMNEARTSLHMGQW